MGSSVIVREAAATGSRGLRAARLRAFVVTLFMAAGLVLAGLLATGGAQAASGESADRIRHYQIDYTLNPDGTVSGRETIDYSFAPGTARRGIFVWWTVRRDMENRPGVYRYYDLEIDKVSSPTGAPTQFQGEDIDNAYRIRIGDPDRTVRGDQTYVIDYTVRGTVNGIEPTGQQGSASVRTQELYLNPVGFYWDAAIDSATVTIKAPGAANRQMCFVGPEGSTDTSRCQVRSSGDTLTFTTGALNRGDGVSVLAEYPDQTVADDTPLVIEGDARGGPSIDESLPQWAQTGLTVGGYGAGGLAVVGSIAGMAAAHRRKGRDEQYAGITPGVLPPEDYDTPVTRGKAGPVAVRFEPPQDTKPGLVGTLIDEEANTVDVSATLIDLAVRGYLRIEETKRGLLNKDDWILFRTDPGPGAAELLPYEKRLYDGVFRKGDEVRLSALKNTFASTLQNVQTGMYRQVVDEGWFNASPEKTRQKWSLFGMFVLIAGVGLMLIPFMVGSLYGSGNGVTMALAAAGGGVIVAGLVMMMFAKRMPARTAKGSAMLAQSRGFEQYLKTAEANQIKFEEAQNIFSRYLPYAIVFGCSERWAKVFDDVAALAGDAGYALDMPTWYVFHNTNMMWNYMILADSLDHFSTTAAGTFTSVPAASSSATPGSSGGSGFSMGGGFSGGGGFGGGGGGSW